jgi:alternate signal-mediated exported protein
MTNRRTKAKVVTASALGLALLAGGSTYALWTSSAPSNTQAVIATGDLQVSAASAQKWTDVTKPAAPFVIESLDEFRMSPGDVLKLQQDLNVIVVGDNISGNLALKLPNDTVSKDVLGQAVFTISVLDKDGKLVGAVTPSTNTVDSLSLALPSLPQTGPTGAKYTAEITVALPKTADNLVKDQVILLNNMAVTLTQGKPLVVEKPNAQTDFQWSLPAGSKTAVITGYSGTRKNVIIPSTYGSGTSARSVTTIEANSFSNKKLESVVIPDSVTSIGNYAFASNAITKLTLSNKLTSIGLESFARNKIEAVALPSTLTSMDQRAFTENNLKSVAVPASLTDLPIGAFSRNVALASVTLPTTLKSIGNGAFYITDLTTVTIPASVTSIGTGAFQSVPNLKAIYFEGSAPTVSTDVFGVVTGKTVYYHAAYANSFSNPWKGYTTARY